MIVSTELLDAEYAVVLGKLDADDTVIRALAEGIVPGKVLDTLPVPTVPATLVFDSVGNAVVPMSGSVALMTVMVLALEISSTKAQ